MEGAILKARSKPAARFRRWTSAPRVVRRRSRRGRSRRGRRPVSRGSYTFQPTLYRGKTYRLVRRPALPEPGPRLEQAATAVAAVFRLILSPVCSTVFLDYLILIRKEDLCLSVQLSVCTSRC